MSFVVGVDFGQMSDFTAVAVLERDEPAPWHPAPPPAVYRVQHLQRFPLRTAYPEIVARVAAMLPKLQPTRRSAPATLLLDVTGVGRAVLDIFHARQILPLAVSIHGGKQTTHKGREWHVPKCDLVAALTVLSQARPIRLHLGERLPFAAEVRREMQTFS